ncbi:MAG: VWA domain-containing protein [Chitinophagales bacterium]
MRLIGFLIFLLSIFSDYASFAQKQGELTQSRILILLDESSSMIQSWAGGKQKYKAADELILRLMDSIYAVNNQVEFSLRVFGHQHTVAENNCYDTKNEVSFSKDNRTQISFRLDDIHPLGVTPIAYSLEQAAEHDLVDEQHNAYSIILITDGGESCNGDICQVMKKLIKNKVYFRPYIVSLEDDPALKITYSCMGDYLQVTKDDDIPKAVNTIVEAFRPIIKLTPTEYKQMQTVAAKAPSVLKVNVPVINVTGPVDTTKAIKTWKDTTEPPPVVVHKIKVGEDTPPRPKAEKITRVAPARLNQFIMNIPKAKNINTIDAGIKLPPIVIDTPIPPPPPPVVIKIPKTEKLVRSIPAHLKQLAIENVAAIPIAIGTKAVNIPSLPPLVIDTPIPPPPIVIKIPKTEKLMRTKAANLKPLAIETTATEKALKSVNTLSLPPLVIDNPIPPPPPPVVIKIPKTEKLVRSIPAHPKQLAIENATAIPIAIGTKAVNIPSLPPLVIDTPIPSPPPPVVIKIPKTEKLMRTKAANLKPLAIETAATEKVLKSVNTLSLPPLVIDNPIPPPPPPVVIKIPKTEKLVRTKTANLKPLTIETAARARALKTVKAPPMPALVFDVPAPKPQPVPKPIPSTIVERSKPVAEKIARLKPARLIPVNVVFVIEERNYVQRRTPALPPLKIDVPKTPVGNAATVDAKVPQPGKKMEYKIEAEDAKESSLEIYLVNTKGEFVTTMPQVVLIDQVTKKEVKKFYRTVDPNGNPDPQKNIPAGTYNVTFPAKKNLVIANVKIEANKKKKITVQVKNVSLSFYYYGAPGRPVKEFGARVIERDKPKGRVQDQLCTATLEYEPGNYHIRINTFPEDVRNVDLDLDDETGIGILQPGFVKFTSDSKQVVSLWKEDGNKFASFHQLDLNDPGSQHKQIQPGKYQVHYHKGPGGSSASEKVMPFIIKSNEETEVILK